jgi:hypothetical protein
VLASGKRAQGRGEMVGIGVAVDELGCAPFIGARGGVVLVGSSEAREGAGGERWRLSDNVTTRRWEDGAGAVGCTSGEGGQGSA